MPAPNAITCLDLLSQIGSPNCPVILDISIDADFDADPFLIPGSRRHPHTDLAGALRQIAERQCVVVCQKGIKLSQGLAARLRCEGVGARYLSGGMVGWRDTPGMIRIPFERLPDRVDGATLWVTSHRSGLGAMASSWLIHRFVDSDAKVLFVSPDQIAGVAERYSAQPLAGENGFETLLGELELKTPALDGLSRIIGSAIANSAALSPLEPGLSAIWNGLSGLYLDDVARTESGLLVFDALYQWALGEFGA